MKTKKIRFTKMQMRHIKTSLLEVMMSFQGDLANDQEDDGTKLEPFFSLDCPMTNVCMNFSESSSGFWQKSLERLM